MLEKIFLHRAHRLVRRNGTVRFAGRLLEVRSELCGLKVELRFDPERPNQLPAVYIDGQFYCDTVELDVVRNSRRKRHRISPPKAEDDVPATDLDPLRLIQAEHERRGRRPPTPEDDPESHNTEE